MKINLIKALSLEKLITPIKKGSLIIPLAASLLLAPKQANAVNIRGYFINSPQCSVKVYRKPTGPVDTLHDETNSFGLWVIETDNFNPPAQQGDTLYVLGGWNLGGKAKTFVIRGPPEYNSLDLHLDKFTGNIKEVIDTSGHAPTETLKAIYYINSSPPETMDVDTSSNNLYQYYDVHAPFDTLQAVQGAQGMIRLEKIVNDTCYFTEVPFTVDRERFDAQLIDDTVYFPTGKTPQVKEKTKKVKPEFNVYPTITQGKVNISGSEQGEIYNATGQKIDKYEINNTGLNFSKYPQGIYFIKPKDSNDLIKIIKTK